MKYLVLDTNIYLHFKNFEQVDWKSLFNDEVTVCVPQRVLVEIDKHKDQSRGKIQTRAKALSSRFYEIFLQGVSPQVPVMEFQNPPSSAFSDPQYDKDISDDWIILSSLYSSINNADIVIVAYDNGILLKAKQRGLAFFRMPDTYLLAVEPSEEEKEIKRLKQEIAKYENRHPDPVLQFENKTSLLTITKPQFIDIQSELKTYEMQLKSSHAYQSTKEEPDSDFVSAMQQALAITYSTLGQKQEYNKALDEYFEKKLKIKEFQLGSQFFEQCFYKLDFWLVNNGTSALGETDIFITFPDYVPVYNQDSRITIQFEDPSEPILKNNLTAYNPSLMNIINSGYKSHVNVEMWDKRKSLNRHDFKFHSRNLTHTLRHPLNSKDNLYIDIANCGNFSINWIIVDSNLIEQKQGQLNVVIR